MKRQIEFISKARSVWGWKYDYSLVNYVNYRTPVCILFKGEKYYQTPEKHLKKRAPENRIQRTELSDFIALSKQIWGDRFDYSGCDFKGMNESVTLYDKLKGREIRQKARSHLNGHEVLKLTDNEYLNRVNVIYQFSYQYDMSEFKNLESYINITCVDHGSTKVKAHSHLHSNSHCSKCDTFHKLKDISKFLNNYNITFSKNHVIDNLSFDFYCPGIGKVIIFKTRQNYQPIDKFGGFGTFKKLKQIDEIRNQICEERFIDILVIKYDVEDVFHYLWKNIGHLI